MKWDNVCYVRSPGELAAQPVGEHESAGILSVGGIPVWLLGGARPAYGSDLRDYPRGELHVCKHCGCVFARKL
jgi:hypothetical protein